MKLWRELGFVRRQIRALVAGKSDCLATPVVTEQRSVFAAVTTDNGAIVVRLFEDTSEAWPHGEYGCFETWTQAQGFASMLNRAYGLDPVEARHIVVSASLAAASCTGQKP